MKRLIAIAMLMALLVAGTAHADKIGLLLKDADNSTASRGYAIGLKTASGDWTFDSAGYAVLPSATDGNDTEINRLATAIKALSAAPMNGTVGATTPSTGVFTSVTDSGLTATRVPFAGVGGLLTDDSDMTFATDTLTVTKIAGALNGTVGATTPASGAFTTITGASLILTDNATADAFLVTRVAGTAQSWELYEDPNDGNQSVTRKMQARTTSITYLEPAADPTAGQVRASSAPSSAISTETWITPLVAGTLTDGKLCQYESATGLVSCIADANGTGDMLAANNLSDVDNATAGRRNLGVEIGVNVQAFDSDLTTWAGVTPGANVATFLATPSSANLATAVTGETGTGALVFGTSPSLTTPAITFDEVGCSADGNITAANVSRTFLTNSGQTDNSTTILPVAAEGYTFVAMIGSVDADSSWKIQKKGEDAANIYWDAAGTLSSGKSGVRFAPNNPIGCRVSCASFKTSATYSWLCGGLSTTSCTYTTY